MMKKLSTCPRFVRNCGTLLVFLCWLTALRAQAQPPAFTCDGNSPFYMIQGSPSALYAYDPRTSTTTLIKDQIITDVTNTELSALGYNVQDNYLWAHRSGTNEVVRIGSDGTYDSFAISGLPAATYLAGDVTASGVLYLYNTGAGVIERVDLTPALPATTPQRLSSVSSVVSAVLDIAFNPVDNQLYSIIAGNLYRYAPSTGARVVVGAVAGLTGDAGSHVFFDASGNMYASGTEATYKITGVASNTDKVATVYSSGNSIITAPSDGASCRGALPTITDQVPFTCEPGVSYVLNASNLFQLDMTSGTTSLVKTLVLGDGHILNAMGYNTVDNYIWGTVISGTNQIARVGADGSTQSFATTLPDDATAFTGDVGSDGFLYLHYTGFMRKVNLNAGPNFLLVSSFASPSSGNDWGFNPIDGQLYSVIDNTLYSHNPLNGTRTTRGVVSGLPVGNYGAIFFDANGTLYAGNNDNQNVYKILNPDGATLSATLFRNLDMPTINDGARCPSSVIDSPEPLTCEDGMSYIISATNLYRLDISTGENTLVSTINVGSGKMVNAFGYNVVDNYLWGKVYSNSNRVVRLGADGSAQTYAVPALPSTQTSFTGDVGTDGFMYLYYSSGTMKKVNLNAGANFLQVSSFPTSSAGNDWAYNSADGQLYSIIGNTLYKHNSANGVRTSLGTVTNLPSGNYGAVFFDALGNLYVGNNDNQTMYKIPDPFTQAPVATPFKKLDLSSINDGARCPNSAVGPGALDDDVNTTCAAIDINVLANDQPGSSPLVASTVRLITPGTLAPVTTLDVSVGVFEVNTTTGVVKFTPVNGFNGVASVRYTVQDENGLAAEAVINVTTACPMPVTLVTFKAAAEGQTALLSWATTMETNSDRFEIERSANGRKWTRIGTVRSQGESSVLVNYGFKDTNPAAGENLYRLKMIDFDHTYTYSSIQSVVFAENGISPVYPNPANGLLTFKNASQIREVSVRSLTGTRLLGTRKLDNGSLDVSALEPGLYVVTITHTDGSVITGKVTVSH
ncbi:Por secretion system C-terminal sorting domain-containing protein [Dyadobacter soli]|uniref:Por secretion system C-terminal sorting domain-containing protein n=1 Tax=Dyadobacter soli TaxID=659014 RepID=A0A1G7LUS5_9BACT|nr:T9SS type A sorting domain-containing protein [Dyadobacter soli]SDF53328.1 Por secretion system C-terminal sorting domain-containing protein [Dyadobacter soli]